MDFEKKQDTSKTRTQGANIEMTRRAMMTHKGWLVRVPAKVADEPEVSGTNVRGMIT